jgi:hypothetical protein
MLRALACILCLSVAGCQGEPPLPKPDEAILLDDYVAAVEGRNRSEYDRLHAEGFAVLLEQGGTCMPWFEDAYWSGGGDDLCWNGPITLGIIVKQAVSAGEGAETLVTRVSVAYLVNPPSDGWIGETCLEFDLRPDGGQLKITGVTENRR